MLAVFSHIVLKGTRISQLLEMRFVLMEKTLYERLGGVFAIAAVVNHFSDEVLKNQNPLVLNLKQ